MKWTDKLDGEFNGSPCKIRVGVSETYSESAILKLTKMVLNINDFNTCEFGDLESDVCIGQEYLQQMKELARDIIDNDYKIASLNNFRDFASNEEWVTWCNFLEKYERTIDNIQQNAQIIDTIPNELFFFRKL